MTPEWVTEYAQDCRQLLGIGDEWQITMSMVGELSNERAGQCSINYNYFIAKIELLDTIQDTEENRQLILHEMMHIALAEYEQLVTRFFNHLPKKMRKLAFRLSDDIQEKTIQRITWGMTRAIKPPDD